MNKELDKIIKKQEVKLKKLKIDMESTSDELKNLNEERIAAVESLDISRNKFYYIEAEIKKANLLRQA